MKGARGYFLLVGLGLILLVNAIVLAGVAWNRQEPADSRLQLSERELSDSYGYGRRENSGIGLSLDYRWPSEEDDALYSGVSPEQMAVLGFWLPAERDEVSIRRYRRQQERDALLVLELDGPAYRREVQLAQAAHAEAQRLQQLAPDNRDLQRAARQAQERLLHEQHAASRLLVVDVGVDSEALRARYADRQRYAIVRAHVRPFAHRRERSGVEQGASQSRWQWQLGGHASSSGLARIHLPQRWHRLFDSLPRSGAYAQQEVERHTRLFTVELVFGRRLEPWIVDLQARTP